VARSPRAGSYGKKNTVIITWFGVESPEYQLAMFKDVIDIAMTMAFKCSKP